MAACLDVLYRVAIEVRVLAWGSSYSIRHRLKRRHHERIADLMDATHNIPVMMNNWEHCEVERIREYLDACDRRWVNDPSAMYRLAEIYDEALRKSRARADE